MCFSLNLLSAFYLVYNVYIELVLFLSFTALIERNQGNECSEDVSSHFSMVLKQLLEENIPGLPPGGGLAAK